MHRILVTEPIAAEGLSLLRQEAEVDVVEVTDPEALSRVIGPYHGLVVRSKTHVTEPVIDAAHCLLAVARAGAGVDNIDLAAATRRGIVVVNAPYGNTVSVAEHTLAMMLALARRIPQGDSALRGGRWAKSCCRGIQVRGKTLGLVGLGSIGTAVARRAQGLEMKVVGYDPFVTPDRATRAGVEWMTWEDVLRNSDFLSLHLPLNEQTRGLVGRRELALMKESAYLINCARGGLVDEEALASALEAGRLAGAALDVFDEEPPSATPLLRSNRIVVTPHVSGSTEEALRDTAVEVAQQLLDVLAGRMPRYPVNAPALGPEEMEQLGPYLDLAERLGSLYAQLAGDHLSDVEVTCTGDIPSQRLELIVSTVLVGLLKGAAEEPVNWINAGVVAQERGIAFAGRRKPSDEAGWANLIELRLRADSEEREVAGTVLRGEPHVVQMDGYWLDFVARGLLLISRHVEQPGILGRMGTVLGEAGVNIHFVQVGRRERGGSGILVLGLDDPLSPGVLKDVLALPSIRSATMVKL